MATKKDIHTTANATNKSRSGQTNKQKAPYVTRYVAVDSHLTERNGSTDSVSGLAGERPAGRKLAQDIANACNQLHSENYEVISIVPLASGRAVEATVEVEERVEGRTYSQKVPMEPEPTSPTNIYGLSFESIVAPEQRYEEKHYVDTGVGYSVTDGVIITAKLRE